jgi:hypothetical protein
MQTRYQAERPRRKVECLSSAEDAQHDGGISPPPPTTPREL